jgi:hypothetical protein
MSGQGKSLQSRANHRQTTSGSKGKPRVEPLTETEFAALVRTHLATVKDPAVTAATRDYETWVTNAWKSEFQQQLALAASYLPSTKPLTANDRHAVEDLIRSLKKLLRGAPLGRRGKSDLISIPKSDFIRMLPPAAERAVAQLVREGQKFWCKENGRQRVPPSKTTELIAEAIKQIIFQWSMPAAAAAKISADEVRRLLSKK